MDNTSLLEGLYLLGSQLVGEEICYVWQLNICYISKGQFLTCIFKKIIVLVNLQEVAGSKKFLELLLVPQSSLPHCF